MKLRFITSTGNDILIPDTQGHIILFRDNETNRTYISSLSINGLSEEELTDRDYAIELDNDLNDLDDICKRIG